MVAERQACIQRQALATAKRLRVFERALLPVEIRLAILNNVISGSGDRRISRRSAAKGPL